MAHKKIYHHHFYSSKTALVLLLMLLQLHIMTMLTVVVNSSSSESNSEDAKSELLLSISSRSGSSRDEERTSSSKGEESFSKEVADPLLTFSLRPDGNNNGSLEPSNPDNNAGIHKAKVELEAVGADERRDENHFHSNKDNEGDNNDSNVSSESDSDSDIDGEELGRRFRREEEQPLGGPSPLPEATSQPSKAISTNWGTYEEQAPVVVHSESHSTIDESDATGGSGGVVRSMATDADDDDDDSYAYGDEYQSKENENDSSEYYGGGDSSISYDDYEGGRFEGGRQFYPSEGGGGGFRQQYYATARPLSQQQQKQISVQGKDPSQQQTAGYRRPVYRNRFGQQRPNQYRQPQQPKQDNDQEQEEEQEQSSGSSLMGFFQKAKTFYDIFQAMNSAWKTVEEHYRKTGKGGVFPEDLKHLNQSTQTAPNTVNQSVNNNTRKMNTKRLRTTRVPITSSTTEEQQQQQQQEEQDEWQEKDEYRSRRSWLKETVNDDKESMHHIAGPSIKDEDDSQITESHLATDSSATASSSSSSSTAIAEGRYIKGDPLKGYYDFVITEGSYKFWAVFQVGTALLIIYSTFAAIYYSKVNPLVSDYDYVDYLGGGRSLSDDSDFVDMDAPMAAGDDAAPGDHSETTPPEGASRSRQQQQQQSSAGWIGWLPHAGHTLRFILESIDKVYNEE